MLSDYNDPRCSAGFQPQFYPTANGKQAPPPDSAGQNDRIVLEFVAAYYQLNYEYSRLLEVRKQPPSPQRDAAERGCLQDVEKVVVLRDSLEDRYAPLGVIAEPTVRNGMTVNVKVSFGNVDAKGRRRSDIYTLTTFVPVPLPKGTKLEDLPLKVEGPGFDSEY